MSEELVVPGIGELVSLESEEECARALLSLRELEYNIRAAKAILNEAIADKGRLLGTQTFTLEDGSKITIKGGQETHYDAQEIETRLRELGMPEERIREIVVEEVSYRVSAREAKRAAAANEEYAAVIEAAKTVVERPVYVSISR